VIVLGFGDEVDQTRKLTVYLGVLLCGIGALLGGALAVWFEREHAARAVDQTPRRGT
jgi:hypothetical protein